MMEEVNPIQSSKWRMHDTFMHEMGTGRERRPFSMEPRTYSQEQKIREQSGFDYLQR